jgi:hypothetical protein
VYWQDCALTCRLCEIFFFPPFFLFLKNTSPSWLVEEEKEKHVKLDRNMNKIIGKAVLDLRAYGAVRQVEELEPLKFIVLYDPSLPVPRTREASLAALVAGHREKLEAALRRTAELPLQINCDVERLRQEEQKFVESQVVQNVANRSMQALLLSPRGLYFGIDDAVWASCEEVAELCAVISPEEGRILEILSMEFFLNNGQEEILDWILFRFFFPCSLVGLLLLLLRSN